MFYIIIIIFLLIFCEIRLFVFCSFGAVLKNLPLDLATIATPFLRHPSGLDPAAVSLIGGKPRGWAGEIISCAAGNQEQHRLTTLAG